MKITTRNIMQILRLYKIASPEEPARSIRELKITDEESFIRASLIIHKQRYVILYGLGVDEDELDFFWPDRPKEAVALKNPHDENYTATPFNGKHTLVFHLPAEHQRLDIYLSSKFDSNISRSRWQQYIKHGCVTVNNNAVLSPNEYVKDTDQIKVNFPSQVITEHKLPIIYQDEDVLVINKPSGVLTHAKGGIINESTVADFMKDYTTFGSGTDRSGIVHRLDRDTSGVIICARTKQAAEFLQKQFANRQVVKEYLAIVDGQPRINKARIDLPIGRNPSKPSTFRVDSSGKPAETVYMVIETNQKNSMVKLLPTTGRTHQLRVHMAHIGTPITGDRVYGKISERLMLHAHKLTITLPSGTKQTFLADIPSEFIKEYPNLSL